MANQVPEQMSEGTDSKALGESMETTQSVLLKCHQKGGCTDQGSPLCTPAMVPLRSSSFWPL